jgi:hypothetical protein
VDPRLKVKKIGLSDAKILILATIIVTIFYVQSTAPVTILLIVVVASIAITMGKIISVIINVVCYHADPN